MLACSKLPAKLKVLFLLNFLAVCCSVFAQPSTQINNPVLPAVADAGVLKYNGEYFIGGVNTRGSFYSSEDLVNWSPPRQAFVMNNDWATPFGIGNEQIHSNDLIYINGKFHLYWNVNYWGRDRNVIHIGHAIASNVLGPYVEPVKQSWFDSRLDPKLFIDDDQKMYFYSVKFSDGNTIWVTPMKDASTLSGEPRYIFASLPNTWETIDNRVAEGPWVIKYRSRYYMMYNANHTSPDWGNYALGVAEASSPTEFNNGNKYPNPVLKSNQVDLEDLNVDVLKFQSKQGSSFQYTTTAPDSNWMKPAFDLTGWNTGRGSFGSEIISGSTTKKTHTIWREDGIWIRKNFQLKENQDDCFALRVYHDGDTRVFLNGSIIYDGKSRNYIILNLDSNARNLLKPDENTIAITSKKGTRSNFVDASLFNMRDAIADDILFTPGQANIVKGPNGFEWWLVYMANKNNERRGQFINRVHFLNKQMAVDGLTSTHSPGYHPPPSPAGFSDNFTDSTAKLESKWNQPPGTWKIANNELISKAKTQALIKSDPATNYLFEVSVKMGSLTNAGIYAWYKDERNWIRITIDKRKKVIRFETNTNNKIANIDSRLPTGFAYDVYHRLGVYKNQNMLAFKLDELPLQLRTKIKIDLPGKGLPGLYAGGKGAAYDGAIYTIGWDESDEAITGWTSTSTNSQALVDSTGLHAPKNGEWSAFKGDISPGYEFSVQVSSADSAGSAGIYPVYIDTGNFLRLAFDYKTQRLNITGMSKGKALTQAPLTLSNFALYYPSNAQTDFMEKHFKLNCLTSINSVRLNKLALPGQDSMLENLSDKLDIYYKYKSGWFPVPNPKKVEDFHPGFERIQFENVVTDEIKFVNKEAGDRRFYTYKVWVNEIFKQSYNLRVSRQQNRIMIFVDNKMVLDLKDEYPASGVGLYASNNKADFNGIMLFQTK